MENFGDRQINLVWRARGMWQWLRGKRGQWGEMKRKGSDSGEKAASGSGPR